MVQIPHPAASLGDTVVCQDYNKEVFQGVIIKAQYKTIRGKDAQTPEIKGWLYDIEQASNNEQKNILENIPEDDIAEVLYDNVKLISSDSQHDL